MTDLIMKMTEYFSGDKKRIQHFIKVYTFASLIGEKEKLTEKDMTVLKTAAVVHDIGIKRGEAEFGRCDGKIQEQLGPDDAKKMLESLGYDKEIIEKVCFIVGHHHTYNDVSNISLQILIEADFIVNACEEELPKDKIVFAEYKVFRTKAGKLLLNNVFDL